MPEGTENKTEEEPTMKNNTYFEELNQIACTFEKAHEAHKALKQQIIDEKVWTKRSGMNSRAVCTTIPNTGCGSFE